MIFGWPQGHRGPGPRGAQGGPWEPKARGAFGAPGDPGAPSGPLGRAPSAPLGGPRGPFGPLGEGAFGAPGGGRTHGRPSGLVGTLGATHRSVFQTRTKRAGGLILGGFANEKCWKTKASSSRGLKSERTNEENGQKTRGPSEALRGPCCPSGSPNPIPNLNQTHYTVANEINEFRVAAGIQGPRGLGNPRAPCFNEIQ